MTLDFDELRDRIKERTIAALEATYQLAGLRADLLPDGAARLKCLSPLRDEKTPSFKIDRKTGRWRDYGTSDRGDVIDLYARLHRTSQGQATMRLAEALGLELPTREPVKPATGKGDLREQKPSHQIVERLRQNLRRLPDRLKYLQVVRGLSESMIEQAGLGMWADRFAIPVYNADRSAVLDIRLYDPDKKDFKMLPWQAHDDKKGVEGTGSPKLFFPPGWSPPTEGETVLFTEGEFDALLAADLGYRALTNTCGATHLPVNGSADLAGCRLVAIGDCDDSGTNHNAAVGKWAWAHGAGEVVGVLWPDATPEGFDVTDALLRYGLREDRALAVRCFDELLRGAVPIPEAPLLFGPFEDFSKIKALVKATTWCWPSWIPNGCLTIIGGDQESGKSFLGLRLAHSIILGSQWPDNVDGPDETGPILWIEAEACHAQTLERAETMGIPLDQLKHMPGALDGWLIDNPDHLGLVKVYARQERVRAVVIDSLSTALGGDENSSELREPLAKVAAVGRDLNIPVVAMHHLTKPGPRDTRNFDINRLRGSSAIKQVARAVIGIDHPDPSNPVRRVTLAKCNFLAQKPPALGYELRFDCQVLFGDPPTGAERADTKFEEALTFLAQMLGGSPAPVKEIEAEAFGRGISKRTLDRAKGGLGVRSFRHGGEWHWSL